MTIRRALFLVKLQAEACNFAKSNNPPWVSFTFFKLYKWCQIAQSIKYLILSVVPQFGFHKNRAPFVLTKSAFKEAFQHGGEQQKKSFGELL